VYEETELVCWFEGSRLRPSVAWETCGVGRWFTARRRSNKVAPEMAGVEIASRRFMLLAPSRMKRKASRRQAPRCPGLTETVKAPHALVLFSVFSWRFAHLATGLTRAICRPRPISACVIYRPRQFVYGLSFSPLVFALLNSWNLFNCCLLSLRCSHRVTACVKEAKHSKNRYSSSS